MLLAALSAPTATVAPPNLLWIMADDLGVGEPGYAPSNSTHGTLTTPNLDALAASGMRFSAAYAGYTVCAPSRYTFFTGRNTGHIAGVPSSQGARSLDNLWIEGDLAFLDSPGS